MFLDASSLKLPERFGHAPQVFILLLEPLELGQDLGELPAGALRVLAVSHQMPADVEEERAPGQQHQGNPPPRTRPGPHGLTRPPPPIKPLPRRACTPTDPAGLPAGCARTHRSLLPRHHKCHRASLGIGISAGSVISEWQAREGAVCLLVREECVGKGRQMFLQRWKQLMLEHGCHARWPGW